MYILRYVVFGWVSMSGGRRLVSPRRGTANVPFRTRGVKTRDRGLGIDRTSVDRGIAPYGS